MYAVKRTAEFDDWLTSITDGLTRIRLAQRLDKVQRGLLGDVKTVADGVCEMRETFGPGWRMYQTPMQKAKSNDLAFGVGARGRGWDLSQG